MARTEPFFFEQIDRGAEDRALEQAKADVAAGRIISHEAMVRWLRSWGTPNELPPPERCT
jgi:predicted transcriptional regulator